MISGRVQAYVRGKHFGFLESNRYPKLFFHARDFLRRTSEEPPAIVGEEVLFEVFPNPDPDKDPRAVRVTRLNSPTKLEGVVVSYNHDQGWGFISPPSGGTIFFHRSDSDLAWVPVFGERVCFWVGGNRYGKLRAVELTLRGNLNDR